MAPVGVALNRRVLECGTVSRSAPNSTSRKTSDSLPSINVFFYKGAKDKSPRKQRPMTYNHMNQTQKTTFVNHAKANESDRIALLASLGATQSSSQSVTSSIVTNQTNPPANEASA